MSNQPLTAVQIKYAVVEASQSVADSDRPSAAAWQRSDPLWDLSEELCKSFPGRQPKQDSLTHNGAMLWG
ncbi:MAG: hypothetical protein ACON5D_02160 [Rubripirellula sp.]